MLLHASTVQWLVDAATLDETIALECVLLRNLTQLLSNASAVSTPVNSVLPARFHCTFCLASAEPFFDTLTSRYILRTIVHDASCRGRLLLRELRKLIETV